MLSLERLDLFALSLSATGFVGFLITHLIVFRTIPQEACLKWLSRLVIAIGGFTFLASIGVSVFHGQLLKIYDTGSLIVASCASVGVYVLFVYIYTLYIFGPVESSIRLRILYELSRAEEAGMTLDELLRFYNENDIVRKRLARFLQAGDLKMNGSTYTVGKRIRLFSIQSRFIAWLRRQIDAPYLKHG